MLVDRPARADPRRRRGRDLAALVDARDRRHRPRPGVLGASCCTRSPPDSAAVDAGAGDQHRLPGRGRAAAGDARPDLHQRGPAHPERPAARHRRAAAAGRRRHALAARRCTPTARRRCSTPLWLMSYVIWAAAALHPSMRSPAPTTPRPFAHGCPAGGWLLLAASSLLAPGPAVRAAASATTARPDRHRGRRVRAVPARRAPDVRLRGAGAAPGRPARPTSPCATT